MQPVYRVLDRDKCSVATALPPAETLTTGEKNDMTSAQLAEIAAHFDGRRHGGIRLPDMTAITNEVIRETFPDAAGLAVLGSAVTVTYRVCRVDCGARLCQHEKTETEQIFSDDEMDALILAHVRGAATNG
jgi:hypothetical protein